MRCGFLMKNEDIKKIMELEDDIIDKDTESNLEDSEEELKENSCQGVQVSALSPSKDQKTYQNEDDKKTNKEQIIKDYWPK